MLADVQHARLGFRGHAGGEMIEGGARDVLELDRHDAVRIHRHRVCDRGQAVIIRTSPRGNLHPEVYLRGQGDDRTLAVAAAHRNERPPRPHHGRH